MIRQSDGKISLFESWKNIRRGLGIIRSLCPCYFTFSIIKSLTASMQPLIVLYMSAQILNELTGKRDVKEIIIYVTAAIGLSFLLSAAGSVVSHKLSVIDNTVYQKIYFLHGVHYMGFDFEHVENSRTNEKLADIEAKINGNGLGIPRLYWGFPDFIERLVSVIVSLVLLIGMFYTTGIYVKNFFTSSFATFILCFLITLLMVFNSILRQKEQIILKEEFARNPKTNTFFGYYRDYVHPGSAGKDIRIYNQVPAIMKITDYWIGMSPWHKYFSFEGKVGGLTAASNSLVGGCVYLLIGLRALSGMYKVGSVVQYVGAVNSLVNNLTGLINLFSSQRANSYYLGLLYDYLDMPGDKYRGTLTTEKRVDNDYEIEFHKVSFKYPGANDYALKNLSLKFHIGQRLAVVGMNGSGKTTMIKLLCRLYDPTEGVITLNGLDIRKYDYVEYMDIFSVVFQDFKLFSYPLGQNVTASTVIDTAKAESCLRKAGFGERLESMPKGLDTCLYKDFDDRGIEISGGEAQKIALSRALYKNAPFIVLDEPTAALDPIAEFEVYSKFNEIVDNKTAIYISHRLSSCRFCDDIAVFHEGYLVQRGSHEQLLADTGGKYAELWYAQAQYYT